MRGDNGSQCCWIPDVGLDDGLDRTESLLAGRGQLRTVEEDVIDEVGTARVDEG